jgi:ubiquinone/menaquinone biosynthesis C-methylase UbiE
MDTPEEADSYEDMDHSGPNTAFVDRLVELGAYGRMLDLGCGPGHIPILICRRTRRTRIVGIDLASHMLAYAQRYRDASGFARRLQFQLGDLKKLDFEDQSFDTVFSNTTVHHIPDPMQMLSEARRVLRPGGVLLIRDLYRPHSDARADELVALHASDFDETQRFLFRASLKAALSPGEFRVMADAAGFEEAQLVIDSDRHMSLQLAAA